MDGSLEVDKAELDEGNRIYGLVEEATEAREQFVKARMALGCSPESALEDYVNNFGMHLPCEEDDQAGMGNYRRAIRLNDQLNIPYKEIFAKEPRLSLFSPLRLAQTPEEFYRTIDEIIEKNGIDVEDIRKLNKSGNLAVINTLTAPLFDELRTMYTHQDLTR